MMCLLSREGNVEENCLCGPALLARYILSHIHDCSHDNIKGVLGLKDIIIQSFFSSFPKVRLIFYLSPI